MGTLLEFRLRYHTTLRAVMPQRKAGLTSYLPGAQPSRPSAEGVRMAATYAVESVCQRELQIG